MTVNDLITAALRRLRVISGSDPPDGDSINDALLRLNDWLDDLKNEDFLDLFERRLTWPIIPGKPTYTMGLTGDVQIDLVPSATDVHNIGYYNSGTQTETLLGAPLSSDAYAAIPNKNAQSAFPYYFYFNADPLASLYPWPIPTSPVLLGVIYLGQTLTEVTINQTLTLPPGYRRFLRDGLALELAPEFHVSDTSVLAPIKMSADEARANIKRKKRRPMQVLASPVEFGVGDTSNIYLGP